MKSKTIVDRFYPGRINLIWHTPHFGREIYRKAPPMQTIRWLRITGETIFAVGRLYLAWFVFGLKRGGSIKKPSNVT